jgi:hypothetical protein
LIFLFAFSYFSKFIFKPSVTTGETTEGTPVTGTPAKKTFSFASASCSASGGIDTVRFKIQAGESTIGPGEMASFLDNGGTLCIFKDSQGNKLNAIELKANSISDEFSCTAPDHRDLRIIMVSSPAGSIDEIVTCS